MPANPAWPAFFIACSFALAACGFGLMVLSGAVCDPRLGFWNAEKIFYGILPVIASVLLLRTAFPRPARLFNRRRTALVAAVALFLLAAGVDLVFFARMKSRGDSSLAPHWDPAARIFAWGPGQVTVPAGFTHKPLQGIDTLVGRFVSSDGTTVIDYDIGELAGEHGGAHGNESLVHGARVWRREGAAIGEQGQPIHLARIAFPDTGCAIFLQSSPATRRDTAIDALASSFRPQGSPFGLLRPFLPELLRSDCRYRVELPRILSETISRALDW